MSRRFTDKERAALFMAADGRSDLTGEPLPDGFHADHVVPVAAGGQTDVANGQALCPEENLAKSCRHVELRGWQKKFAQEWFVAWKTDRRDFLLCALPGAGKTIAALWAASEFLRESPAARVVIVTPSVNLREQWQKEAWQLFGISLQSKEFRGTLKGDHQGAIVTYQAVPGSQLTFRRIVAMHPTMVIFDEIHHAGEGNNWGDMIRTAFEQAAFRLSLSGTPFRTDGTPIPFMRYDDDRVCIPDFQYDYPTAIREGVVRVVSFHHHAGKVEYLRNGEHITGEVHQDITDDEAQRHLRNLLEPSGTWVRTLLQKAHQRLIELRRYKHDAGGLVLCIDKMHALAVANVLREVTGQTPAVVLSDDEHANSSVQEYRASTREWIVAVRQISEGVDIKRLMVLCYFTIVDTSLFFRQAVGRIVRNQGTEFDEEAYCYLPDDPRLVLLARDIINAQAEALKDEDQGGGDGGDSGDGLRERAVVTVLNTTEADFRGVIIEGQNYQDGDAELIREVSREAGIPEAKAAVAIKVALAKSKQTHATLPVESAEPPHRTARVDSRPPEEEAAELRRKIKKNVHKLSIILKRDNRPIHEHQDIHTWYLKNVTNINQGEMSNRQLKAKLAWVDRCISRKNLVT